MTTGAPLTLADMLAALKARPAPAPKVKAKAAKRSSPAPRPQAAEFNYQKTGYVVWKPRAKVILLEEQTCECCGSVTNAVKDELFLLDNKTSHSSWLRHEGYEIEHSEDLPIEARWLEPRTVSACATCFRIEDELRAASAACRQLHLPI